MIPKILITEAQYRSEELFRGEMHYVDEMAGYPGISKSKVLEYGRECFYAGQRSIWQQYPERKPLFNRLIGSPLYLVQVGKNYDFEVCFFLDERKGHFLFPDSPEAWMKPDPLGAVRIENVTQFQEILL